MAEHVIYILIHSARKLDVAALAHAAWWASVLARGMEANGVAGAALGDRPFPDRRDRSLMDR